MRVEQIGDQGCRSPVRLDLVIERAERRGDRALLLNGWEPVLKLLNGPRTEVLLGGPIRAVNDAVTIV